MIRASFPSICLNMFGFSRIHLDSIGFFSLISFLISMCAVPDWVPDSVPDSVPALVARKPTLPVQNGTNLKVDFFECLDPPRCHMGKKFGFHHCPLKLPAN